MTNNGLQIIMAILLCVLGVMLILLFILFMLYFRMKSRKKDKTEMATSNTSKGNKNGATQNYKVESIMDFMEFDKVEDNMIVAKNGEKYIMVVSCQGVNYDLMSTNEKIAVEEGFVQFLNSLRSPIQLYVQTRTVNLESSVNGYKEKLRELEQNVEKARNRYEQMKASERYSKDQLDKAYYEVTKQTNLYEYGKDIINNTEKMSLNKNVLSKNYYVVIPYYTVELGANNYDKEEKKNMAFSELYTRAQAVMSTLAVCGVTSKVLSSNELVELLYIAYNRDDSEIFGIEKALQAGYEEIYSTAPDVLDKKMRVLDKEIQEKGLALAQEKYNEVQSEKQLALEEKERTLDDLIKDMAQYILQENESTLGKEDTKKAIEKVKKSTRKKKSEGGETENGEKKTRRRRTTKTA